MRGPRVHLQDITNAQTSALELLVLVAHLPNGRSQLLDLDASKLCRLAWVLGKRQEGLPPGKTR